MAKKQKNMDNNIESLTKRIIDLRDSQKKSKGNAKNPQN